MKVKTIFLFVLLFLITARLVAQTSTECSVYIKSNFDSECIISPDPYKPDPNHEETTCLLACSGSDVIYYAENLPDNSVCEWFVSGSQNFQTSNQGNYVIVSWPEEAVMGNISLQVTTPDNLVCLAEVCIEIIEKPVAGIISNPTETEILNSVQHLYVCDGQSISFSSNSTGSADAPIVGYYWTDGRNSWSTESITLIASHEVYGDEIKLYHKVINECGCYDELIYIVHISRKPKLKVDCYGTVCEGKTVTYASIDDHDCNNFLWSVNGGEIVSGQSTNSVVVTWNDVNSDGYGYLAVDNRMCNPDGCPFLTYLPIPVIVDSVNISGPDIVCLDEVVIFEAPLWGSTLYDWSVYPTSGVRFYNELTPNKYFLLFSEEGTYTIKLNYQNDFLECAGIAREKTIVVKKGFDILSEAQACVGSEVNFNTSAGPDINFEWRVYNNSMHQVFQYIGDKLDYTFLVPGSYTVTAYSDLFCNTVRKAITIYELPPTPNPDVSEWESRLCRGVGYIFEADNEPPYYLHWESCGTPQAFDANEFNVSFNNNICDLRLMNVDPVTGCISEPFVFHLEQFTPQAINLGNLEICANSEARVQVPIENNVLYEWSSLSTNMISVSSGRYSSSVLLQANNASGTANMRLRRAYCNTYMDNTIPVSIVPGLVPAINYPVSICQGEGFNLQSANTGNTILGTWTWSIEGNISTTSNAAYTNHFYTFRNSGTVTVKLSFTGIGCTNTYETVVSVNVLPAPDVSLSFVPNGSSATLYISDQSGSNSYVWSVDGQTGNPITVNEPFASSYTCTVTGSNGCSVAERVRRQTHPETICDNIDRGISASVNCGSASFSYTSNSIGNTPKYWDIEFNSSAPRPVSGDIYSGSATATFTNAGSYTVIVEEIYNGCMYHTYETFEVPVIPRMNIIHECPNNNNIRLKLQNTSDYVTGVNMNNTVWTINGNTVIPNANGYVTVPSGMNTIKLRISYTYNGTTRTCETEETFNHIRSFANFTTDPAVYCTNTPIQFTDNSGTAVSWNWGFGSIAQNNSQNPRQTFQSSGYVNISLQIQDHLGCISNTSRAINVGANGLDGDLTATGTYCTGEEWPVNYRFTDQDVHPNVTYNWYPENETTVVGTNTFTRTGSYYAFLEQPSTGCQYQSTFLNLKFENKPVAFVSGNETFCAGDNIMLYGNTGNFSYTWKNLSNNTTLATTANLDMPAEDLGVGTHRLRLDVTNGSCSDFLERIVVVHPWAAAPAIRFGENMCLHNPPVILQSSENQMLYWSTGTYGTATNAYVFGNHTAYYLDNNGCKSKYSYIYVPKNPDFDELLTGCFKMCEYTDFPRYLVPPMGIYESWSWIRDGRDVIDEGRGLIRTLAVDREGLYNLKITYADGNCRTVSPDLVIENDCENANRECNIEMELLKVYCEGTRDCTPRIMVAFDIINESLFPAKIRNIILMDGVLENYDDFIGRVIDPQSHRVFEMHMDVTSILSDNIIITIEFEQGGLICKKELVINLENVRNECTDYNCDVRFDGYAPIEELSSLDMLYYEYFIYIGRDRTGIEVYSSDVITSPQPDSYEEEIGIIKGVFSITPARMREIATSGEEICFTVKSCDKYGESMCIREVCFTPDFKECVANVYLKGAKCFIRDCELAFIYDIYIENLGGSYLNLMQIVEENNFLQILEQPDIPMTIPAYSSRSFAIIASVNPEIMHTELTLLFVNERDVYCRDQVYLPIATIASQCAEKKCEAWVLDMVVNNNLSTPGYLYMDFVIQSNIGADDARVVSSYGNVISSLYNPLTGIITGILEVSQEEYYIMLREEVCFDITLCYPYHICKAEACWATGGPGENCDLMTHKLETECGIDSTGLYVEVRVVVQNNSDYPATLIDIGIYEGNVFYISNYPVINPRSDSRIIFRFYPADLSAEEVDILYLFEINGNLCIVKRTIELQEIIADCIIDAGMKCIDSNIIIEQSYHDHIYVNFTLHTFRDGEILGVSSPDAEIAYYSYDPVTGYIDIGAYFSTEEIEMLLYHDMAICFDVYILYDNKIYRSNGCCRLEIENCKVKVNYKELKCYVENEELYIRVIDMLVGNNASVQLILESIMASNMELELISPPMPYAINSGEYQYFDLLFRVVNPEAESSTILLTFGYDGDYCIRPIRIPVRNVLENCVSNCDDLIIKEHWSIDHRTSNSEFKYIEFGFVFTDTNIANVNAYPADGYENIIEVLEAEYWRLHFDIRILGMIRIPADYTGPICMTAYITDIYGNVCRAEACEDQANIRSIQIINDGSGDSNNTITGGITLYPNPATDMCSVNLDNESLSEIIIIDLYGREIIRHNKPEFSVAGLAPGSYIVSVRSIDNNIKYLKLLKQ